MVGLHHLLRLWFVIACIHGGWAFDVKVADRVVTHLGYFLQKSTSVLKFVEGFRVNGGFRNNMTAGDRDVFLTMAYSLQENRFLYFGLEDGTVAGLTTTGMFYREPGNAYDVRDPTMQKYLNACVSEQGEPEICLLQPGDPYVQCAAGPDDDSDSCDQLEVCPGSLCEENVSEMGNVFVDKASGCASEELKWCRKHQISQISTNSTAPQEVSLGYVPTSFYCSDIHGQITEEIGAAFSIIDGTPMAGNGTCYYQDGQTLVDRALYGDYAYCQTFSSEICSSTYMAAHRSSLYDARFRPWYTQTKEVQASNWSPTYIFFFDKSIGMTYCTPLYSMQDNRKVFDGVLALDVPLTDIKQFLSAQFGDSSTMVAIYEDDEPNNIIALSTPSDLIRFVLRSNSSVACPPQYVGNSTLCVEYQKTMAILQDDPVDDLFYRAYEVQKRLGYPMELQTLKELNTSDSRIFGTKVTDFQQDGIRWKILVLSEIPRSSADEILIGHELFVFICGLASGGVFICVVFFVMFYRNRAQKAVINADWRFSCAFIGGCALLNVATFVQLGHNNDRMCLLRPWCFHLAYSLTMSILVVKIWRMKQLVGSPKIVRKVVSNLQAATLTLRLVFLHIFLLTLYTFFEDHEASEYIQLKTGVHEYRVVCPTLSPGELCLVGLELTYVVGGCVLAYQTRKMDPQFGESKQLLFTLYNILLVSVISTFVVTLTDVQPNGLKVMHAIGTTWITLFGSAVFVLPRWMDAKEQKRSSKGRNVHITGLTPPPSNDTSLGEATPQVGHNRSVTFSLPPADEEKEELHVDDFVSVMQHMEEEKEEYNDEEFATAMNSSAHV